MSLSAGLGNLGKFLKNRTCVITGSTSGIGLGVAEVLALHGGKIILNSFEAKNAGIDRVVDELKHKFGVDVEYVRADMTKPEEVRDLIHSTEKKYGSVDVLVNNAGIQFVAPISTFPDEQWDRVISTNLSSVFHSTKAALPGMQAREYGRIINIASAHGLVASANKSAYVAAKHGVVGFSKATALDTATWKNVTVNAVCPGFVPTPLAIAQVEAIAKKNGISVEQATKDLLMKHPSGEWVSMEDIGNMVAYICSPYTSQLTGQAITMDAGWTAQ